jgi:hypothetical protein
VYKTASSYAQCFAKDAHHPKMGVIKPASIQYSAQVHAKSGLD